MSLRTPLVECLAARRSQRPDSRAAAPDGVDMIALLHYASTTPAAGGLRPVQLYAATDRHLIRYDAEARQLQTCDADPTLLLEWMGAAMGNATPPPSAILLGWQAGPLERKYRGNARRLAYMDAGAIYMALGLVCAALDLMGCGVGPQAFADAHERAAWPYEELVGGFAVGRQV